MSLFSGRDIIPISSIAPENANYSPNNVSPRNYMSESGSRSNTPVISNSSSNITQKDNPFIEDVDEVPQFIPSTTSTTTRLSFLPQTSNQQSLSNGSNIEQQLSNGRSSQQSLSSGTSSQQPSFMGSNTQQSLSSGTNSQQPSFMGSNSQQPSFMSSNTQQPSFMGSNTQQPSFIGSNTQQSLSSGTSSQQPSFITANTQSSSAPSITSQLSFLPSNQQPFSGSTTSSNDINDSTSNSTSNNTQQPSLVTQSTSQPSPKTTQSVGGIKPSSLFTTNNSSQRTNIGLSTRSLNTPSLGEVPLFSAPKSKRSNYRERCSSSTITGSVPVEIYLQEIGYISLNKLVLKNDDDKVCSVYIKSIDPTGNLVYINVGAERDARSDLECIEGKDLKIKSIPYDFEKTVKKLTTPSNSNLSIECSDNVCMVVNDESKSYKLNNDISVMEDQEGDVIIKDTFKYIPVVNIQDIMSNRVDVLTKTSELTKKINNHVYNEMLDVLEDTDSLYREFKRTNEYIFDKIDDISASTLSRVENIKQQLSNRSRTSYYNNGDTMTKDMEMKLLSESLNLNNKQHELTKCYKVLEGINASLGQIVDELHELKKYVDELSKDNYTP